MTLNEGLIAIGRFCFQCTAIAEITIPNSVTSIGQGAFSGYRKDGMHNYSLKKVTLSSSLKYISEGCFSFSGLTQIDLRQYNIEVIDK